MDVYGKCNWIKYHGVQWVQGSVGNHDEGSRRWPNKPPIAIWSAMNSLTDLEHSMHSMHSTLCPLGAASTVSGLNTVNTLDVFDGRFCKFASCIPCIPCWTWECFSTTFGTGVKRVNTNTSRYWKKCRRSGANINHNTTLAIATRPQLFGPVQSSTTFRQRKNVRPWKVWTNWRTEDTYGLCQWACMTDLMMFNVLNKHRNCVCNHSNLKALASRDSCGVQRNLCQCAARR